MSTTLSSLPPSVEQRIAGWIRIQERLAHQVEPKIRPSITLSRQFGCEGFPLAERLKALMEAGSAELWNIYDKTLLEKVAHDEGISMDLLKKMGDLTRRLEALGLHPSTHVNQDAAFEKVANCLLQIAKAGNAIIVGRGGAIKEVEETVKTNSKLRDKFISHCLGANVGDLQHYDAVFNNERHSLEIIAQSITTYVKRAWEDKTYFKQ